jgi:hypothetical protein
VGLERRPVGVFASQETGTGLVVSLLASRRHHGRQKCVVHFEGIGEMCSHMRRHGASRQGRTERPMGLADIAIAETGGEIASG